MKDNYYIIAIIAVAVIALLLGALPARLYTGLWEWKASAADLKEQVENQRKNTRALCLEKLNLTEQLTEAEKKADELAAENKKLNALIDSVLAELETPVREEQPGSLPLPEGRTNVISGMPYTAITNHASEQWKLQCDGNTFTGRYGIRCYCGEDHIYIIAAMGSAYGRTIGDTFRVTLKCSSVIYVMLGEFKDDGTDPNFFGHPAPNYDKEIATCILEFIYDPEKIDAKVRGENGSGTFTVFEEFGGLHGDGGDIVKIEYLGRRWEP